MSKVWVVLRRNTNIICEIFYIYMHLECSRNKREFPRDYGNNGPNRNEYNNYLENGKAADHAFYVEKDQTVKGAK